MENIIYLDYQATTPTDPRVVAAMLPYFNEKFGNPHSINHALGREAAAAVETARAEIARLISADPREVIFTSGATESNNLAIKGAARFLQDRKDHVVTLASEHKCVLECVRRLEREGFRATVLPVGSDGLLDIGQLAAVLEPGTALVSVMAANNEIGVLQPLAEIGALCRARGVLLHSDAAQAVGKVAIDVNALNLDLLSISGHKLYGPMGIGALYVRRRPRVRLIAQMDGGGQERGLRSGTLPAPLCVGLGEACRLAAAEMAAEGARLAALRDALLQRLSGALEGVTLNGHRDRRLPGNLNLAFAGVGAEALIEALPGLALSTGSACTSASVEPSYVLKALGLNREEAGSSLRISLGRTTSADELERAGDAIIAAVRALRGDPRRVSA